MSEIYQRHNPTLDLNRPINGVNPLPPPPKYMKNARTFVAHWRGKSLAHFFTWRASVLPFAYRGRLFERADEYFQNARTERMSGPIPKNIKNAPVKRTLSKEDKAPLWFTILLSSTTVASAGISVHDIVDSYDALFRKPRYLFMAAAALSWLAFVGGTCLLGGAAWTPFLIPGVVDNLIAAGAGIALYASNIIGMNRLWDQQKIYDAFRMPDANEKPVSAWNQAKAEEALEDYYQWSLYDRDARWISTFFDYDFSIGKAGNPLEKMMRRLFEHYSPNDLMRPASGTGMSILDRACQAARLHLLPQAFLENMPQEVFKTLNYGWVRNFPLLPQKLRNAADKEHLGMVFSTMLCEEPPKDQIYGDAMLATKRGDTVNALRTIMDAVEWQSLSELNQFAAKINPNVIGYEDIKQAIQLKSATVALQLKGRKPQRVITL